MLLDRHRIAKLIELADLERRLTGAERQQREEDVALLIKAAYDDASDAARGLHGAGATDAGRRMAVVGGAGERHAQPGRCRGRR